MNERKEEREIWGVKSKEKRKNINEWLKEERRKTWINGWMKRRKEEKLE